MNDAFPSPTTPIDTRAKVFLGYLDYFRDRIISKMEGLSENDRRRSRLPSGWSPRELVKHLTFVELRWLEWGFAGREVEEPWGDHRAERWQVTPDETTEDLIAALRAQGARSRAIIEAHDLASVGRLGPRWDGAEPATSSGSCSTSSRSTPVTSVISMSSPNSAVAPSANRNSDDPALGPGWLSLLDLRPPTSVSAPRATGRTSTRTGS